MDHLMKLVTTTLEWTYAEARTDVTTQTLEAAVQLLMLQRDSIPVIDDPAAKQSQTISKEETQTETPVRRPKKTRRAQASQPEMSLDPQSEASG